MIQIFGVRGGGAGYATWGYITGNLPDQTDLWNELLKRFDKTADDLDDINEGATNKHLTNTLKSQYDTAYSHSQSPHPFGLVGTKEVDETGISHERILKYNALTGKYVLADDKITAIIFAIALG
jgi:hypothetical protein